MSRGTLKVRIPTEHRAEIGLPRLREILRQAGISDDEWSKLAGAARTGACRSSARRGQSDL
jgi:hypothetical protein